MVALDRVQPLLAIVASKGVDVLLVDDRCREGALRYVHRRKELPLVLMDVVVLTAIQENVLVAVVATHDVDVWAIDHRCVLLPHLVHARPHHDLAFAVDVLVDCGRGAATSDEGVAVWQGDGRCVVHEVEVLGALAAVAANVAIRVAIVVNRLDSPFEVLEVEEHDLIRISKESDLFIAHQILVVINLDEVFELLFDSLKAVH